MSALPFCTPFAPAARLAKRPLALAQLGSLVWQASAISPFAVPTAPTGWAALDAELPGGGWPLAGLIELLLPVSASGELALLQPWLGALERRELGAQELLWVAPPGVPCTSALQAMNVALARLVCVKPASLADAAWAVEQALRAGSCAAVLWWNPGPCPGPTLRRLHLAAQAGATPLIALRPAAARRCSSPAPLRLACSPLAGRQLAVEVFKRRGPPMGATLTLDLPWPASASGPEVRKAVAPPVPAKPSVLIGDPGGVGAKSPLPVGSRFGSPHPTDPPIRAQTTPRMPHVVDRPAPAAVAAASPALVASGA